MGKKKKVEEKWLKPGEWDTVGFRHFDEEDFGNVPEWIADKVRMIYAEGPSDEGYRNREYLGRTFLYRLDFDGPEGELMSVSRRLKDQAAKNPTKPYWEEIGRIDRHGVTSFDNVPNWIQSKIKGIYKRARGSELRGETRIIKGKNYRYKLHFGGRRGEILIISRKAREWYWKEYFVPKERKIGFSLSGKFPAGAMAKGAELALELAARATLLGG